MLGAMKRRAPLVMIVAGVVLAGFMVYGFTLAAGSGPELGGPVVVSRSAGSEGAATPERTAAPEPAPETTPESTPEATREATPEATPEGTPAGTPEPAASPSKRKTKAEPVRPPSPRPGGDDDDDDDGGDDDD